MKHSLILVCLWFFSFVSSSSVSSEAIPVVTEFWPPYIYYNDEGEVSGALAEKVRRVLDHAAVNYKMEIYPWARAYDQALSKDSVLIFPLFRSKSRLKDFHFICPLTSKAELFFVKLSKRNDIIVNSIEEAKRYTIGLIRNDYIHELLLQHGFMDRKQLDVNADDLSSFRKLLKGRIDLMVLTKGSADFNMGKLGVPQDEIEFAYKIDSHLIGDNCIAFGKNTPPELIRAVQNSLDHVNRQGPLLNINN